MTKWFKKVWFQWVIFPYILKNKPQCTLALKDAIVFQMWRGDVKFPHINKWLRVMKMKPIKGYVMTNEGPRLFYQLPTGERKAEIVAQYGPIIMIA